MQRAIVQILVIASTLIGLADSTFASALFTDFGPSDGYTTNAGWTVGNSTNTVQWVAFSPTQSGAVTQIDLGLNNSGGTNGAVVSLWTDVSGNKGTELGSWSVSNSPPPFSGGVTTASSITGVSLTAGSLYFLQVAPADSTTSTTWGYNTTSATGLVVNSYAGSQGINTLPAFDIISAVPLPPSVWLMLGGLSGLGILVRRRTA